MITANLPALVVLAPLFFGLFSVLTRSSALSGRLAIAGTGAAFLGSCALLRELARSSTDTIVYEFGAWPPEYGIAYHIDPSSAWMLMIVSSLGFLSTIYAQRSVEDEIPAAKHPFFWCVWQLALCGLLGICATGDAFNVYVLLEISSLTVYTLIATGRHRDRRALTASFRYLVIGSVGATFILFGIGCLLMLTGTLNMDDIRQQIELRRASGDLGERTLAVAVAFLTAGIALKAAVWPLHGWMPDSYTYAPSAVTVLVGATATKVAAFMGLRFLYTTLGDSSVSEEALQVLALTASAGIVVSAIQALRARNVKRILAFSSIGQLGYIVLGLSLPHGAGLHASLLHVFNHAVTKGAMFMALGVVVLRLGGTRLELMRGLGRRLPWSMGALSLGAVGLVGMPGTAGFLSKWYLLQAAIDTGQWLPVVALALGGILALAYVWRLMDVIWFQEPVAEPAPTAEAPWSMRLPMLILVGASLLFGIWADFSAGHAVEAAQWMLGGAQP